MVYMMNKKLIIELVDRVEELEVQVKELETELLCEMLWCKNQRGLSCDKCREEFS